ncbi:MAG: hypothetical protein WC247_03210 [Porticoccaceae bacterium]|jgi:hypothetical protein
MPGSHNRDFADRISKPTFFKVVDFLAAATARQTAGTPAPERFPPAAESLPPPVQAVERIAEASSAR